MSKYITESTLLEYVIELQHNYSHYATSMQELLAKYFGYDFTALFVYNTNQQINYIGLNGLDTKDFDKHYHKSVISYTNNSKKHDNIFEQMYSEKYYQLDPFQPMNLPDEFKNRYIINCIDLPCRYSFYKSEFFCKFLSLYNVKHVLALYIKYDDSHYGHILIMKRSTQIDFTSTEIELLSKLAKYISYNYKIALDLKANRRTQNLLHTYCNNISAGFSIITGNFEILEINNKMIEYCNEIDSKSDTAQSRYLLKSGEKYASVINTVKRITFDFENINVSRVTNIKIGLNTFTCTFIPYMFSSLIGGMESMYIFQIDKNSANISSSLAETCNNYSFTKREREIVEYLVQGYKNRDIAQALFISEHTVKVHIANIFKKVCVTSRTELIYKLENEAYGQ